MARSAMVLTSLGIVAEKRRVWRVSLGGRNLSIVRMAGRKPMSRSWSASSKMRHLSWEHSWASPEFSRWSLSLPGVATSREGGLLKPWMSLFMLVPPTMHITVMVRCICTTILASSSICCASSLVGDMMRTEMPLTGGSRITCSTAGMRKESVLPVPVLALARRSTPVRATGIDCCCTIVIVWYRITSAMLFLVRGCTWSSSKALVVI
mmetsp:Transcript_29845/g.75557  ORF Transcript_29845/g.75557 Transcript_29845/m.75557 type:complete len:208 (-) Transcript_29845:230-853(-)